MKKLLFIFLMSIPAIIVQAQNDSIAVSQIKELGVYYLRSDTIVKIEPIMTEGTKGKGNPFSIKTSIVYEGENSNHVFQDKPTFYIFIPSEYKNRINAKQFRLVTLDSKKGQRTLVTASASVVGAKTGAKTKPLEIIKLSDECYKAFYDEIMPSGHYGIFYNYAGGIPLKLYDFDIISNGQ